MSGRVLGAAILSTLLLAAGAASGETSYVFKHDQFSDSIQAASQELSGIPLATQPGFVKGEAFGVVFKPTSDMYPVKIQAIDVVLAAMPNDIENSKARAVIEIYYFDGDGPDPGGAPVYTLSTDEVFNMMTGEFGQPLQGDTAMSFEFDWDDDQGHPPPLNTGNFLVAVRFSDAAGADLTEEWGSFQCMFDPGLGFCGCQKVGTLHDQASTAGANVLHIIYPPGNCDGAANQWVWFGDVGVTGDVILRARTKVADAPCVPSCQDKECGDDGCGGSCGECGGGDEGVAGACQGPCEPDCDGKVCGDDGCGGVCGDCAAGKICTASGQCVDEGVCNPVANCAGKECGTDGCGGVCGICPEGSDCVQGACSGGGDGGEFTILSVSPEEGCNDEDIQITVVGSGFVDGMSVILGVQPLTAVVLDKTFIRATVPAGMKSGSYDLIVTSPDDESKFFPGAFKVVRCGGTGCGVGRRQSAGAGLLLLLAGLALVWRRARA